MFKVSGYGQSCSNVLVSSWTQTVSKRMLKASKKIREGHDFRYVEGPGIPTCIYMYINMYIYIYTNVYIYVYVHTRIHTCTYIHMYVYMCIYIYKCTYKIKHVPGKRRPTTEASELPTSTSALRLLGSGFAFRVPLATEGVFVSHGAQYGLIKEYAKLHGDP